MPEAEETGIPPPELVQGEMLLWKMADVKGLITRHLVTGYLVTNFRCFIWDVEKNIVEVSVPISLAELEVEGKKMGKRSMRGGSFIVPRTADYIPPPMGEVVEMGDLRFRVGGESVMEFREVAEQTKVKSLIEALRAQVRVPGGLGVDVLWRGAEPMKHRSR
jgi:hypothetical protein